MGIDYIVREINAQIAKLEQARDMLLATETPAVQQRPERPARVPSPIATGKIPTPPRMRKLKAEDNRRIAQALKKVQARQVKKKS